MAHQGRETSTNTSFKLPPQTLKELSVASSDNKSFEKWLNSLPKGNTGKTARQIYEVLDEITRLETTSQNRFELLELIRPVSLTLIPSLSKHFLNQPIVLPPKASQVANITQTILSRLAAGYKAVIAHGMQEKNRASSLKIVRVSLHRTITLSTLRLLHNFQLYSLSPKEVWHDLYNAYYISEFYNLCEVEIRDTKTSNSKSTIKQEFIRAVMLAAANPNQLRQTQIKTLYDATNDWSTFVKIDKHANPPGLFYLDLLSDAPPTYHNWLATDKDSQLRNIYFGDLVQVLEKNLEHSSDTNANPHAETELLVHLCKNWGNSSQRTFTRTPQKSKTEVAIGFSASHYFLSGEMEFKTFIRGGHPELIASKKDNLFLNPNGDPLAPVPNEQEKSFDDIWSLKYVSPTLAQNDELKASQIEQAVKNNSAQEHKPFTRVSCNVIDTSPGGYCIEWNGEISGQLRNGEVISLKEEGQESWQVGVIRWINQISADAARVGVELLSPRGQACGAAVIHKKGPLSEFIRVIQLPEIPSIGQVSTLLTPSTCFHEGDKVFLAQLDNKLRAKLLKRTSSTSGYCQFVYELLEQDAAPGEKLDDQPGHEEFNYNQSNVDDIWKLI